MIIATALGELFSDMTITYNNTEKTVNYHYGDQQELLAWIALQSKAKKRKYPLIWYILNDFTEFQGWYTTDATLVILQETKSKWFNPKRQTESYTKIIDPVFENIKVILSESGHVNVMGSLDTMYTLQDRPNYGIDSNAQDLNSNSAKSIAPDVIDGRIIKFKLRIQAKCLIN